MHTPSGRDDVHPCGLRLCLGSSVGISGRAHIVARVLGKGFGDAEGAVRVAVEEAALLGPGQVHVPSVGHPAAHGEGRTFVHALLGRPHYRLH